MSSIDEKRKKAKKLKVSFVETTTEDELDSLIKLAEEQEEIRVQNEKDAKAHAKKNKIVLKNTDQEEVDQKDYFFPGIDEETKKPSFETAPVYFNKTCGYPVDREELIAVFNKVS